MLPFSTNFVAPNGTLLTAFRPVFYDVQDPVWIQNNRAIGSTGGSSITAVNDVFLADQYAKAILAASDPGFATYIGVAVRCGAPASGNGYAYMSSIASNAFLLLYLAGVFSVLGTGAPVPVGAEIGLKAEGNVITPLVNGVVADIGPVVDATLPAGRGGIAGYRASVTDGLGSFITGNLHPVSELWPMGVA